MANDTKGDSKFAKISAHKVRLHVIIRFRAQGNNTNFGHISPTQALRGTAIRGTDQFPEEG